MIVLSVKSAIDDEHIAEDCTTMVSAAVKVSIQVDWFYLFHRVCQQVEAEDLAQYRASAALNEPTCATLSAIYDH